MSRTDAVPQANAAATLANARATQEAAAGLPKNPAASARAEMEAAAGLPKSGPVEKPGQTVVEKPAVQLRDGVESSKGTPVKPQATPLAKAATSTAVLATLDALREMGGPIKGDVGQLADLDFEIGPTSSRYTQLPLTAEQRQGFQQTGSLALAVAQGRSGGEALNEAFSNSMRSTVASQFIGSDDVNALVQWVLREAYIEGTLDLRFYAEKVKHFNMQKKAIREQLQLWRKMNTEYAGLSEEEKGTASLSSKGPTGSSSGYGSTAPIVNPGDRDAATESLIALFHNYSGSNKKAGSLEALLNKDPAKKQQLLKAIPHMTASELRGVLAALGGSDMKLGKQHKGLWNSILKNMRPDQVFAIAADPVIEGLEYTEMVMVPEDDGEGGTYEVSRPRKADFDVLRGGFAELFRNHRDTIKPHVVAELKAAGIDVPTSDAGLAQAYRELRIAQDTEAARAANGAADASMLAAINALLDERPTGWITTADMLKLIVDGAADKDGQMGKIELDDLKAFVAKYGDRMSPGAKEAVEVFEKHAQNRGAGGGWGEIVNVITATVTESIMPGGCVVPGDSFRWDDMIKELDGLVSQHAEEDAALNATEAEKPGAPAKEPPKVVAEAGALLDPDIDNDPSDGQVDDVMLNSSPPPYLIASGDKITTVAGLETAIKNLEEKLASVGDDAQLANVDLQNILQKQQQLIQMLSNIGKMLHDTAMAVIRKIGS